MEVPTLPAPLVAKRKREDEVQLCCRTRSDGSCCPVLAGGFASPPTQRVNVMFALQTVCAYLSSSLAAANWRLSEPLNGGLNSSALSFTGADGQAGDWRAVVTRVYKRHASLEPAAGRLRDKRKLICCIKAPCWRN